MGGGVLPGSGPGGGVVSDGCVPHPRFTLDGTSLRNFEFDFVELHSEYQNAQVW